MNKTIGRDIKSAARVARTAAIVGVSKRTVNYVLNGERENEKVMDVFMTLVENERTLDNELTQAVRNLIPFN